MSNFTEEIKNQLIKTPANAQCAQAALSAFIRCAGSVFIRNGEIGFKIITENEKTAEFFCEILENFGLHPVVTSAKFDVFSGRDKFAFECAGKNAMELLVKLGLANDAGEPVYGIKSKLVKNRSEKIAYFTGAFLGGGSCTLPDENTYSRTGYHFEIAFGDMITAGDFCELLLTFDVFAKCVKRKETAVVYVKSSDVISDILNLLSCKKSLEKLNKIVEYKDRQNNANRINNCSVSNIDKTVTASVKQVQAIEVISQTVGLQSLDKNLFDVAECRLADKNASMNELAERLNITKSCICHRMRKILAIADALER